MKNVVPDALAPPKRRAEFTYKGETVKLYAGRPKRLIPLPAAAHCNRCGEDKPLDQAGYHCPVCQDWVYQKDLNPEIGRDYVLHRYPRIVAQVMAFSSGYATPSCAAAIIADAIKGQKNYCEWIMCCYRGDARDCLRRALRNVCRRAERGPLGGYYRGLQLVAAERVGLGEPEFAAWF